MNGENKLVIIENGKLRCVSLDDKLEWKVGRVSENNVPDIKLHSATVSRRHGKFQNMDGDWYYIDLKGKNGTVYNEKHIGGAGSKRIKPVLMKNGDIFIFGGGEDPVINSKTVWALYTTNFTDPHWRIEDTRGMEIVAFSAGGGQVKMECPKKGTVIELEGGMAIYMGDITYLTGNMKVAGE